MTSMEEWDEVCEILAKARNKALMLIEELAKASNVCMIQKKKTHKIGIRRKRKSVKRVPDSKMSTYNYKSAVKRNLPYQRRNF